MASPFIGIDFGTCNSSAAWFNPKTGQAEVLSNAEGDQKTPSVVYFGPKGEVVIGRQAEDRLESAEGRKRVLTAFKRNLARPAAQVVGDRRVTPLQAVALTLGKIKWDAEKLHFHNPVDRAVITCPAVFTEVEKDKLREAATSAGFRQVELLEEPVAAAHAYAEAGVSVGRSVLVYDLGGGTFDLALLARDEDEDQFRLVLPPRGDRVGGEDFDRALYDLFEASVQKAGGRPISPDGLDLHLLRLCRKFKESLTWSEEPAPLRWDRGSGSLKLPLTRAHFERLIEKSVERTVRLTRSIQEEATAAGYRPESVILIGGASRTPLVVKQLEKTLNVEPRQWQKQDVAVALGAAYHAQRLWGAKPSARKIPVATRVVTPVPEPEPEDDFEYEPDEPETRDDVQKRKPCPVCREMILAEAVKCRFCGERFDEPPRRAPGRKTGKKGKGPKGGQEDSAGRVCSILSIICGCIAFLFCPPLFGIAGVILGIVGVNKSENKAPGFAGIGVSVAGTVLGMVLSAIAMSAMK